MRTAARAWVGLSVPALAAALGASDPARSAECTVAAPCRAGGLAYVVAEPAGWDGKEPIGVAVWLHGYRQQPSDIVDDKPIMEVFSRRKLLLVVPAARDMAWAVPGNPVAPRDDVAAVAAVVEDVARGFNVDARRSVGLGFSLGASMLYTIACQRPGLFAHYVAVSGGFWRPFPSACAPGAVDLVHIHGLADRTMPLAGRPVGRSSQQGDIMEMLDFWRRTEACGMPEPLPGEAGLTCRISRGCKAAATISFCLHEGAHWYDAAWIGFALDRALGAPSAQP